MNNTHKDLRLFYYHLNVKLPAEESAIDDVTQINELSSILSHQSQNKYLLILSSLLMISFFFEFKAVSTFSSAEVYFCEGFIHYQLHASVIINALKKLKPFNFTFINNHKEILKYFNRQWDVCIACHQYNKAINFKIHHFSEIVSIYMQGIRHQCTKLSSFPHKVQWFIDKQELENSSGNLYSRREVSCNSSQSFQPFQKLKRCIEYSNNSGKRVRVTWNCDCLFMLGMQGLSHCSLCLMCFLHS